jgi:hypothetical protein
MNDNGITAQAYLMKPSILKEDSSEELTANSLDNS